jgi:hypothetical protein
MRLTLIGLPADGREQLPHLAEQAFNVFGPANERLTTAPPALEQILGLPRARSVRCDSKPVDQLAFGRGIHLCVGINLAKLEALSYLAALARHVQRFEVVGEPQWLRNNTLHGLCALPVTVTPAG